MHHYWWPLHSFLSFGLHSKSKFILMSQVSALLRSDVPEYSLQCFLSIRPLLYPTYMHRFHSNRIQIWLAAFLRFLWMSSKHSYSDFIYLFSIYRIRNSDELGHIIKGHKHICILHWLWHNIDYWDPPCKRLLYVYDVTSHFFCTHHFHIKKTTQCFELIYESIASEHWLKSFSSFSSNCTTLHSAQRTITFIWNFQSQSPVNCFCVSLVTWQGFSNLLYPKCCTDL